MTDRDNIENLLLQQIHDLRPLDESSIPLINQYKDGIHGFSYLGLMLYANGHNAHSSSTHYPRGLIYENEDAIFGVGVFFKPSEPGIPQIGIIAPRGKNWQEKLDAFSDKIQTLIPEANIFVRHLNTEAYTALHPRSGEDIATGRNINSSWYEIDLNPWLEKAPREDETFPARIIPLQKMLRPISEGAFNNAGGDTSPSARRKRRENFNAFQNFLNRNDMEFVLEAYTPSMQENVRQLVRAHFDRLKTLGKAIGSTDTDYENIIAVDPVKAKGAGLHMYVGYLKKKGGNDKRMVSFFGFEDISAPGAKERTCGGYANITSYDPALISGLADDLKGFNNNISTYALGIALQKLQQEGYAELNMGGSETKDLDYGKSLLGAHASETKWAVRLGTHTRHMVTGKMEK